jgi:hypothetical protein
MNPSLMRKMINYSKPALKAEEEICCPDLNEVAEQFVYQMNVISRNAKK